MGIRSIALILGATIALFGCSSIAESQTTDLIQQDTVYKRLSPATVNGILRGMGLEYKEIRATDGRYIYQFELGGFGVGLTLQETGEILELFSGFPMDPPPSLKAINEWNKTRRLNAAYFDDEGRVVIRSALDVTGGVSRESIKEFIRTFRSILSNFPIWLQSQTAK
ncbi:MAG: YbjN domain-containing protein [Nitrospira sp.]|nr:YbjN domain-containing protein [Nitrospira sp.]